MLEYIGLAIGINVLRLQYSGWRRDREELRQECLEKTGNPNQEQLIEIYSNFVRDGGRARVVKSVNKVMGNMKIPRRDLQKIIDGAKA